MVDSSTLFDVKYTKLLYGASTVVCVPDASDFVAHVKVTLENDVIKLLTDDFKSAICRVRFTTLYYIYRP